MIVGPLAESPAAEVAPTRRAWLVPVVAGLIGALGGALIGGLSSAWVANLQFRQATASSIRESRLAAYDDFLWTLGQVDLEMDQRIAAWGSSNIDELERIRSRAEKNEEQFRRAGTRALLVATNDVLPHINNLIFRQTDMFAETNPERVGGIENARRALLAYRIDNSKMMADFMRQARKELKTAG